VTGWGCISWSSGPSASRCRPTRSAGWQAAAIRFLAEGFPRAWGRPDSWPLCARLLPHSEVVIGRLGAVDLERQAMSSLMNLVGLYLHQRAEYLLARPLNERALAITEKVLGPEHPRTATSLDNLANLLRDQGELDAARALHERALAIREKVLGPEHPRTATSLNNLANLLRDQGELDAARALHDRALAIREKVLGPEHPQTATNLNDLALVLCEQGEVAAARPLLKRALPIREKVLGPEHPETASSREALESLPPLRKKD
jgi:tetratricopeptide (TPR) repeat protein